MWELLRSYEMGLIGYVKNLFLIIKIDGYLILFMSYIVIYFNNNT